MLKILSLNPRSSYIPCPPPTPNGGLHNASIKKIESEEGMKAWEQDYVSLSKGLSLQVLKINVKRVYMKSWLLGRHAGASAVHLSCSLFLSFLVINN